MHGKNWQCDLICVSGTRETGVPKGVHLRPWYVIWKVSLKVTLIYALIILMTKEKKVTPMVP